MISYVHAALIYQLKFSVVKTLHYTVLALSSYVASYPVITIFRKLEVKSWIETMHVFAQVVLGLFSVGPFMLS